MPGDGLSVSTMPTRAPRLASTAAALAAMFGLPVPPQNESTDTVLGIPSAPFLSYLQRVFVARSYRTPWFLAAIRSLKKRKPAPAVDAGPELFAGFA
jgi:hypothetical protein